MQTFEGVEIMITYTKLWILLKEKGMKRTDLKADGSNMLSAYFYVSKYEGTN